MQPLPLSVVAHHYIIFADIIAVTATLAATIHYIYSRLLLLLAATLPSLIIFTAVIAIAANPFIIFSLPPVVLRLPLMPPYTPLPPTIIAAATAVHYLCCRCREYNHCYRHRRYYSNTIATDVIANAIAAVISTAVAVTVSIKF